MTTATKLPLPKPMIGKIKKGKNFAGLTKYILDKEEAELVCTNLAGDTSQDFYRQLEATCRLNPRVQFPVSHISISFAPGEKPDKEQLEQIVEATLAGMGFDNNLYFAATHNDRNHFHLHVAASRIKSSGECVSDWYDFHRLEKTLRSLEQQFDLTPVPCSWEVNRSAPSTGQKRRMMREQQEFELSLRDRPADKSAVEKIQDTIDGTIQPGITITQFLEKLDAAGVEAKVKVTREGVIQGISYSIDGVAFQGGKLGRNDKNCTLQGLQHRGVTFDLKQDAKAIATRATSNSQKKTPTASSLIALIQSHPKNLSLTRSPSFSETWGSGGSEDTDTINTSGNNPVAPPTGTDSTEGSISNFNTSMKHISSGERIAANAKHGSDAIAADQEANQTIAVAALPAPSSLAASSDFRSDVEPVEQQLAEAILPQAGIALNYSIKHSPHKVSNQKTPDKQDIQQKAKKQALLD